jgi:DNA topoisomerase I
MAGGRRRLRRSDCSGPGLRRVKRGRGFGYLDETGSRLTDEETLARVGELAIPPAWTDVWICADPLGHLQATGGDAAGRKQYLYHPLWREQRDRAKFRHMIEFARALPRLRRHVAADLELEGLTRERVLAAGVRLLDFGLFRIGSEEYADQGGGLGLATLRREHVAIRDETLLFDYPAKGGIRRAHKVSDPQAVEVITALKRRRRGPDELLAYRSGRRWHAIRSDEINEYLKVSHGDEFTAKDFRTWNATVLAAAFLAANGGGARTKTARKRLVHAAVREVADVLGNTPAVARRAYIDPRVFDRYRSGSTVKAPRDGVAGLDSDGRRRRRLELQVIDLLSGSE